MNLNELVDLERGQRSELIQWLQRRYLLPGPLNCAQCNQAMELKERNGNHVDRFLWRCSGCKKKRSLRTNSFFAYFPKVPLATFLRIIYYFVLDDSQRRTSRVLEINAGLVSQIYRRQQDVCSEDLQSRPITPFGGPGSVAKCDESKFNQKVKYNRGSRFARDSWVFGIVSCDYTLSRGYFQVVQRRDAATLLPIINRCVRQGQKCTATIGLHTTDYFACQTSAHIKSLCTRIISLIPAPAFTRRRWNLHGVTSNCPKNREKGYEEKIFNLIWMSGCGDNGEGAIKETKCEIFWPFFPFNFQRILQFFELFVI